MIGTHTMHDEDLLALATGLGGPGVVRRMWSGQQSRRLHWVWQVMDSARGPAGDGARADLVRAAQASPGAVGELLTLPMVGAWAAAALPPDGSTNPDRAGAMSVAAAWVAGIDAEATIAAENGWALLPGVGVFRAQTPRPRISTVAGRLWIDGREAIEEADWYRARRIHVGESPGLEIVIEDCDPHRRTFHVPPADRLDPGEVSRWEHLLTAAWRLLNRHAPARAAELSAGLQSIVPLAKPDRESAHSATSTTLVGVIGLDMPPNAAELAITLVHEFQHSKLAALHTITPLHHASTETRFRVPWRSDLRPLSGALQGLYAFLGVADTWRALQAEPSLSHRAELQFAETRALIREPARQISRADGLTYAGRRLAAGLKGAVDALDREPVSPEAEASAERVLESRRSQWS